MKGQILTFEENKGIILGEDENRYEFSINDWKEKVPPIKGAKVDFEIEDNKAKNIYLLEIPKLDIVNELNLKQNTRLIGGFGAIFILLSWIPYVGIALYILGLIFLTIALKDISDKAQNYKILKKWLISIGLIFFIAISFFIAIGSIAAISNDLNQNEIIGSGLAIWFIFFVISQIIIGILFKQIFTAVSEITGETLFKTAANTFFWGGILSFILIGGILFFIGWILVAIAFFSLKKD